MCPVHAEDYTQTHGTIELTDKRKLSTSLFPCLSTYLKRLRCLGSYDSVLKSGSDFEVLWPDGKVLTGIYVTPLCGCGSRCL